MIVLNSFEEFLQYEKEPGYFVIEEDASLNFIPPWIKDKNWSDKEKMYLKHDAINLYSGHDIVVGNEKSFSWSNLGITCKNLKVNSKSKRIKMGDVTCKNLILEGKNNSFGDVTCENDILLLDGANIMSGLVSEVYVEEVDYYREHEYEAGWDSLNESIIYRTDIDDEPKYKVLDANSGEDVLDELFETEKKAQDWIDMNCSMGFYCEEGKKIKAHNILCENDKSEIYSNSIDANRVNAGSIVSDWVEIKSLLTKSIIAYEVKCQDLKCHELCVESIESSGRVLCLKELNASKELHAKTVIAEEVAAELVDVENMYAKALEGQQCRIRNSFIKYITPEIEVPSGLENSNEKFEDLAKIKNGPALISNKIIYIKKDKMKNNEEQTYTLEKKLLKNGRIEKLYMSVQEREFRDMRSLENKINNEDKWSYLDKRGGYILKGKVKYPFMNRKMQKAEKERILSKKKPVIDKEL